MRTAMKVKKIKNRNKIMDILNKGGEVYSVELFNATDYHNGRYIKTKQLSELTLEEIRGCIENPYAKLYKEAKQKVVVADRSQD